MLSSQAGTPTLARPEAADRPVIVMRPRGRRPSNCRIPAVVASALTVLYLPLGSPLPGAGLDPSWGLGLSMAHIQRLRFGSGLVFNYGPLGFLSEPSLIWRPGALLGLLYAVVVTWCWFYLVGRTLRQWLPAGS